MAVRAIGKSWQQAFVVPLDQFVESFLPRLPRGINNRTIGYIMSSKQKENGMSDFCLPFNANPSSSRLPEVKTFKSLKSLFDETVKRARKFTDVEQTFEFVMESHDLVPTMATRPAIFVLARITVDKAASSHPYSYHNVGCFVVFKKRTDEKDTQDVSASLG